MLISLSPEDLSPNGIDRNKYNTEYPDITSRYFGGPANLPGELERELAKYSGKYVLAIRLRAHLSQENKFRPGNLAKNLLAVPLFPLALGADILLIPVALLLYPFRDIWAVLQLSGGCKYDCLR